MANITQVSELAATRAADLIDHHQAATGLEGDRIVILTHILADIQEWCYVHEISLDGAIAEAREMLRESYL